MTFNEFQEAFAPILSKWKNNYSPEQVDRICGHVKDLNKFHLKLIVSAFLDTARQAPLPRDFLDASRAYKKRLGASCERPEYRYDCQHCLDSGVLSLTDKSDGHKTYCRCDCSAGQKETWKLPIWGFDMAAIYKRGPLTTADTGFIANQAGEIQIKDLDNLRDLWKEKIKIAEMYWGSNG